MIKNKHNFMRQPQIKFKSIIMTKSIKLLAILIVGLIASVYTSSCSKDDDEIKESLVGRWEMNETETYEDGTESLQMILIFNSNHTGSIEEKWTVESRSSYTNRMTFNWSTSTDSNGNDILKVSYVSGDKETVIFDGSSSTALWTRQYVLTGNILNIYQGSGVWVLNRK